MVPGCLASSVLHPSRSLSAMMVLRFLFGEIRLFREEASNGFSAKNKQTNTKGLDEIIQEESISTKEG